MFLYHFFSTLSNKHNGDIESFFWGGGRLLAQLIKFHVFYGFIEFTEVFGKKILSAHTLVTQLNQITQLILFL
jgi:hypothetical protein